MNGARTRIEDTYAFRSDLAVVNGTLGDLRRGISGRAPAGRPRGKVGAATSELSAEGAIGPHCSILATGWDTARGKRWQRPVGPGAEGTS